MMPTLFTKGSEQTSQLPGLLGLVVAIVLWLAGDEIADRVKLQDQQLATAINAARRTHDATDIGRLEREAEAATRRRRALEAKLHSDDDIQLIRAKLVYELRLKCAAAAIGSCSVRLSEDTGARAPQTGTAASARTDASADAPPTLARLGIDKVRAIVYGSFKDREFAALSEALASEAGAQWRVNGLVVRAAAFELDVERHVSSASVDTPGKAAPR
jgi:hypothetical protein